MFKYAIVLPAGSGKTTLSQKYNFFIDIGNFIINLNVIGYFLNYSSTVVKRPKYLISIF
jgi:predicted NACHT family NTPase